MDIHHELIIHTTPERVFAALTQPDELAKWWGAPVVGQVQPGTAFAMEFPGRSFRLETTALAAERQVQWRVVEAMWPVEGIEQAQVITWTLEPFESSALVSFRLSGWPRDDGVFASVSYKTASYLFRLKVYLGDTRELAGLMVRQE